MNYLLWLKGKPVWVLALAFILTIPALFVGWLGDDYLHYVLLHPRISIPEPNDWSLFGLFSWVDMAPERNRMLMDWGVLPWWVTETFRSQFWRPLAEISHWLDHLLWRDLPFLMHLQSNLWYLAVGAALYRLFRVIGMSALASVIGLAAFALDSTHGYTVGWIANRNALMAAFFAVVSLIYFARWQQETRLQAQLLSIFFLLLSLLSGEIGISVCAYLAAYVVVVEKTHRLRYLLSLWPFVVTVISWWVFYKLGNFGADNWDNAYIDPLESPLAFMARLFERLPILYFSQFGLIPADVFGFMPKISGYILALIFLLLGLLVFILWPLLKISPLARFWGAGLLMAAVPLATTIPADRNLMFVGIGGSALVGLFLAAVLEKSLDARVSRYGAYGLFAMHLVIAPLLMPLISYSPRLLGQLIELETNQKLPVESAKDRVLLFGLKMPIALAAMPMRFADHQIIPENLWLISSEPMGYTIERTGPDQITVLSDEGMINDFEQLVRDIERAPLNVGDVVETNIMLLQVESLDEEGHPTALEIQFEAQAIDDAVIIFWDGKAFGRMEVPQLGDSIRLNLG